MTTSTFEPLDILHQVPLVIEAENVDTDQIYPARFLAITCRNGLGDYAFYDWRRDSSDKLLEDSFLDAVPTMRRQILLAGRNFGC